MATITVTVTNGHEGSLVADVDVVNETFTNTYRSSADYEATGGLDVTKTLSGRALEVEQFEFHLWAANPQSADKLGISLEQGVTFKNAEPAGDGVATMTPLSDLTFTQADAGSEYVYFINEVNAGASGYDYDSTQYAVVISVTDNNDGTLSVTTHAYSAPSQDATAEEIEDLGTQTGTTAAPATTTLPFANEYSASGKLTGSTDLIVSKTFTGREDNAWLDTDVFTFTLAADPSDRATVDALAADEIVFEGDAAKTEMTVEISSADPLSGTLRSDALGNIAFNAPGDHEYKFIVTENRPAEATEDNGYTVDGITYDVTTKYVTVTVTDDGQGNLTASVKEGSDALAFTNTYGYPEISLLSLDLGLEGNKVLSDPESTGREFEAGDSFTFRIEPGVCVDPDGQTLSDDVVRATLPDKTEDTINPVGGTSAIFSFASDGTTVDEDKFTFTQPGTYRYLITEVNPNASQGASGILGVSYDQTVYRLTVVVTDNDEGALEHTFEYTKQVPGSDDFVPVEDSEGIVFTNVYNTNAIDVTFNAFKVLEGASSPMTDNQFKFRISYVGSKANDAPEGTEWDNSDATTAPMPAVTEIGNYIRGNVVYGNTTFTHDNVGRTYCYAITEVQPTQDGSYSTNPDDGLEGATFDAQTGKWTYEGVTYDNSTKYVTARVFNEQIQGADGSLVEQVRVETAGEAESAAAGEGTAIFTNTYAAASATATISVQKTLGGRAWLETDDFGFVLTPEDNTQPMPAEAQADGEGNVSATLSFDADADGYAGTAAGTELIEAFGTIVYTQADLGMTDAGNPARSKTFTYYVDETNSDGEGITADAHVATVTVTVTDNGDGTMSAQVRYANADAPDAADAANTGVAAFTNTYTASMDYGAVGGIQVTKQLTGKPMAEGDFSFTIAGADAEDGTTTTADADAKLAEADKSFENGAAANIGDVVTMDKLQGVTFTQADAGKTFSYVVAEVIPAEADCIAGVDYDATQYRVDIQVVDNHNGTLRTLTTVSDGEGTVLYDQADSDAEGYAAPVLPFVNTYTPDPVSTNANAGQTPQVTKKVAGADAAGAFSFDLALAGADDGATTGDVYLTGEDGALVPFTTQTLATTADMKDGDTQTLTFADITFTAAGTYTFTVTETSTAPNDGWTYDTDAKTITIIVSDEGYDGQLDIVDGAVTGNNQTVENRYVSGPVTIGEGTEDTLPLSKTVTGNATEEGFNFTLTPVEEQGVDWSTVEIAEGAD